MTEDAPNRQYYPALDGIRGVAILLVVVYHNFNFLPFFNYGWIGVDVFFVLSGFLITDILINTVNTPGYLKNFYLRRILRIFPLYYLSLLLFLVILPSFSWFQLDVTYFQKNQWWFWTYLQNWLLIFKYDGKAAVLVHFWSLAVEEQYYLIWPFIILLIKKPRQLIFFCIAILVMLMMLRFYIYTNRSTFQSYKWLFLFTRIDGLIIGSLVALIYKVNRNFLRHYSTWAILLLAVFNFLIYFLHQKYNFNVWVVGGYSTFAAIFSMFIYEAVKNENKIINLVFTNPVLRFLGKYSYGFYIFHFPVFLMVKPFSDEMVKNLFDEGSKLYLITSSFIATISALIVSIISYHLFEKRFLALKTKIKYESRKT